MFKLNLVLFSLKNINKLHVCRLIATDATIDIRELSFRKKVWLLSKEKYDGHKHILYSSYLEPPEKIAYYEYKKSSVNKSGKTSSQIKNEIIKHCDIKPVDPNASKLGTNWMDDYEYFSGSYESNIAHNFGTENPTIRTSNVPCSGCGAFLNCNYSKSPGYIPSEIFEGRTETELKTIICQRCHFLKHYNEALEVEILPESYMETISSIRDKFALAIVVVDLLDFPCSIWPDIHQLLGSKRPVFIVGNKVDLLPICNNSYLDHIKKCLMEEILKIGFNGLNIKYISVISAKTGYGIEELITQLHKIWSYKGDVYLMGCTNVGKSSLFNILLNSDYCRRQSAELIHKATTCPWPGTTLQMLKFPIYRPSYDRVYERFKRLRSERFNESEEINMRRVRARKMGNVIDAVPVGSVRRTITSAMDVNDVFAMSKGTQPITTLNESAKEYAHSRWVYDTPGVLHPDQITNLLTTHELEELQPKKMISPRSYRLQPGMSLFVAGLSRLDFIESDSDNMKWVQIFLFASFHLPTMIVETEYAAEVYTKYLNTPFMKIPMENEDRLRKWPGLQCHNKDLILKGMILNPRIKEQNCSGDITLSSSGWVGINMPVDIQCVFRAWTPNGKGVHLRSPSLIPYAGRLVGKRMTNVLAYSTSRPFVFRK